MVIYISTPQQLDNIRNNLSGEYELTNDIDMSGFGNFTPIGTSSSRFKGKFNGNGFVIKNLTVNNGNNNYSGLFGYCENATIQNLGLKNVNIKSTANYSGGLIGYSVNTTISNCYVDGYVTGNYGVGGLVGWFINASKITNCYTMGTFEGTGRVGGLVGNISNNTPSINNAYSWANVSATNTTYPAKALIGDNQGGSTDLNNLYYNTDYCDVSNYGIGLTTAQFADSSNFLTFDTSIWGFANYPYLKIFGVPAQPTKTVTIEINTHLNALNQSIQAFKRKVIVNITSTNKIDSSVNKTLITSVKSLIEQIISNVDVKQNANIKTVTVDSNIMPITSYIDRSKKVYKALYRTIEPIQSLVEVIIPDNTDKPIYANVYAITNNTDTYALQNPTNTYIIENPTRLEVI